MGCFINQTQGESQMSLFRTIFIVGLASITVAHAAELQTGRVEKFLDTQVSECQRQSVRDYQNDELAQEIRVRLSQMQLNSKWVIYGICGGNAQLVESPQVHGVCVGPQTERLVQVISYKCPVAEASQ